MGWFFLWIALIALTVGIVFVLFHLRALTPDEVEALANKRRKRSTEKYFSFSHCVSPVDLEFKKAMDSRGRFYSTDEGVSSFPSTAAGLLKYKKHEWIVIAFERERRVIVMWANKGPDGTTVTPVLTLDAMLRMASAVRASSVIVLHNHPHPGDHRYPLWLPSRQDLESAKHWAAALNNCGVNLIEFVCERGRAYRYFFALADVFYPIKAIVAEIEAENGMRAMTNLKLHWERLTG